MDCSPPGSSVRGISQARILDGLSCPPPLPYMTTGKTIALTIMNQISKNKKSEGEATSFSVVFKVLMFLVLNALSQFVIAFLSRIKHLLISWLQ